MSTAESDGTQAGRLLTDIAAIGGRIWVDGEKLRVDAPTGALNQRLQARIRAQRGALVKLLGQRETGITPIARAQGQVFPLSLHQHAFFMLDQMDPGNAALNVVSVRRIREPVDPARLSAALDIVATRHESLRTVFAMHAGRPVQRVVAPFANTCLVRDLSGAGEAERQAAIGALTGRDGRAVFNLAAGPLFRLEVLKLGAADFVTGLFMHHIVSDAVSIELFYAELITVYRDGQAALPPLALHYADYAAWQDRMLRAGELDAQIEYWREALQDLPALLPRLIEQWSTPGRTQWSEQGRSPSGGVLTVQRAVPATQRADIHRLAKTLRISPFSLLLALFQLLLSRASRSADIPVIVPVSGRSRPELQTLIGLFVSGLVLRVSAWPLQPLVDYATGVAGKVAQALDHQDVSIESLEGLARQRRIPLRGLSALSKIGFNYLTPTLPRASSLAVEILESDRKSSVFDLFLVAVDGPDSLGFKLEQSAELLPPGDAERLLEDYIGLVAAACAVDPSTTLQSLAPRDEVAAARALGAPPGQVWPLTGAAPGLAAMSALACHVAECPSVLPADSARLRTRHAGRAWPGLAATLRRAPAPFDAAYLVGQPDWPERPSRSGNLCQIAYAHGVLTVRLSPLLGASADAAALADFLAGRANVLPALRGPARLPGTDDSLLDEGAEDAKAGERRLQLDWELPRLAVGSSTGETDASEADGSGAADSTAALALPPDQAAALHGIQDRLAGQAACLWGRIAGLADPSVAALPICVLRVAEDGSETVSLHAPHVGGGGAEGVPGRLWLALRLGVSLAAAPRLAAPPGGLSLEILIGADGDAALRCAAACRNASPALAESALLRFAAALGQVLGGVAPDGPLDLLLPQERASWDRLNAGWQPSLACDVIASLRHHAASAPHTPALADAATALDYAALADLVSGLAGNLTRLGPASAVIGVMVSRGIYLAIAPLGILAAGATYVPLDPALPDQVLADIAARAGLDAVLADAAHAARADELFGRVQAVEAACRAGPSTWPMVSASAPAPAYRIFTSGSTGRPKAVDIGRLALMGFLAAARALVDPGPGTRLLAVTSPAFDISLLELLLPVCCGGTVIVAAADAVRDGQSLSRLLRRQQITHLQATPSLWRLLVESGWEGGLSLCISGGEALPPSLARALRARCKTVWNFYGPTEATIWCAAARINDPPDSTVPIGRPLANSRLFVIDRGGALLPPGAVGELVVGGDGIALGYAGDPERTKAAFAFVPGLGRVYRTGDQAMLGPSGLVWLGRLDRQIKHRGHRIELAGIEAALLSLEGVRDAASQLLRGGEPDAALVGYVVLQQERGAVAPPEAELAKLRRGLRSILPPGSLPDRLIALEALPRHVNGKVNYAALGQLAEAPAAPLAPANIPLTGEEASRRRLIATLWTELLGHSQFGEADSFFDVGGHSILVVRLRDLIAERTGTEPQVIDLFSRPRIADMAALIGAPAPAAMRPMSAARPTQDPIAIIGLSARFPGAPTLAEFWENLLAGRSAIKSLTEAELLAAGLDQSLLRRPDYVRSAAIIEDADRFDAGFFRISPREAAITDPQHRLLLEHVHAALEDGGYGARPPTLRVGLFAGAGFPSYFFTNLQFDAAVMAGVSPFALLYANEKDYAVAQIAYRLDLRGPCMTVATACSTGLVAVHQACRSLAAGECDIAIAAAAKVMTPMVRGYVYSEGGIVSPDGICRPFDADARGTVFGSGVAAVLLKRLDRASADGDPIRAVIRGTAVNNDGAGKIGLTAPSQAAQAEVLSAALAAGGVAAETVGFIEAHGTGTALGDPIELSAIAEVYDSGRRRDATSGSCFIGAVKGNIGHLDPVAGLAGLVKTVLALEHGVVPPTANYRRPNQAFRLDGTRFAVNAAPASWPLPGPRRASVSAFGIGGTNVHAVLEQAPEQPQPSAAGRVALPAGAAGQIEPAGAAAPEVLPLSAHSAPALARLLAGLAAHFDATPQISLASAAATLQLGRAPQRYRTAVVAKDCAEAVRHLRACQPPTEPLSAPPPIVFLLPGQTGAMPRCGEIYSAEPLFRAGIDRSLAAIEAAGGPDLRALLGLPPLAAGTDRPAMPKATGTALEQPALFAVGLGLAALWQGVGIQPAAVLGHSLGELVAATVAGVMSLEDAARLVVLRGRLMQDCPPGAMALVHAPPLAVEPWLGDCDVAAYNGDALTVIAGPAEAIAGACFALRGRGYRVAALPVDRAFHSRAMAPACDGFARVLRGVALSPPAVPLISCVTGTWMTEAEATDPAYWSEQIIRPVCFAAALRSLFTAGAPPFVLELGLSGVLAPLALRCAPPSARVVACGKAGGRDSRPERDLASAVAELWRAGAPIDWAAFRAGKAHARARLPTYPFERERHWIEGSGAVLRPSPPPADPADWVFETFWLNRRLGAAAPGDAHWLLLGEGGLVDAVESALRRRGAAWRSASLQISGDALDMDELPDGLRRVLNATLSDARDEVREEDEDSLPLNVLIVWPPPADEPGASHGHSATLADAARPAFTVLDALIRLGRCLARDQAGRALRLAVAASGLFTPLCAAELDPLASLALGPMRGLPRELPDLRTAAICTGQKPSGARAASLAASILAEFDAGLPDQEVALGGPSRMVPLVQASPAEAPVSEPRTTAPDGINSGEPPTGALLITGGLGDLGLALAHHLVARGGARLAILGRQAPDDPAVRAKLASLPPETLYLPAPTEDGEALTAAVASARARFGRLDRVYHLAGSADGRLLPFRRAAHTRSVIAGKVLGALHLAALAAGQGFSLVLFSSITGRLVPPGQMAYAAANAVLDALAARCRAEGAACIAIAWDAWQEIGMAARHTAARLAITGQAENAIPVPAGLSLLDRLEAHAGANPIVCPSGWAQRAAFVASLRLPEAAPAKTAGREGRDGPRDRATALAALWEKHLGVAPIGLDEDFFALGGNSLLAVGMLGEIEAILGRRVSPDILLRAPTLRQLANADPAPSALRHLVVLRQATPSRLAGRPKPAPLVLVHPIGGEVLVYRAVIDKLAQDRDVFGLRGGPEAAGRYASVSDMAEAYVAELRASLGGTAPVLAGSSFGGIVALEMGRMMAAGGQAPARIVMMDSPLPGKSFLRVDTDADILAYIGESLPPSRGNPAALLDGSQIAQAKVDNVLAVFRANQALMDRHAPQLDLAEVHFVKAADRRPRFDPPAPEADWRPVLPRLRVHVVPGDHVTMHAPPHAAALAARLDRIMADCSAEGSAPPVSHAAQAVAAAGALA